MDGLDLTDILHVFNDSCAIHILAMKEILKILFLKSFYPVSIYCFQETHFNAFSRTISHSERTTIKARHGAEHVQFYHLKLEKIN